MAVSIVERGISPEFKTILEERLKKLEYFWLGPDICAAETRVLLPGKATLVNATLRRDNLPPIDLDLIESDWRNLNTLLKLLRLVDRSRGAQVGLITKSLVLAPGEEPLKSGQFQEITAKLEIAVVGGRPIEINKEEGIACLYSDHGAEMLLGQNLANAIGTGIIIDGNYKKDWCLIGRDYQLLGKDEAEKAIGLGLRLTRYWWMPPSEEPASAFNPDTTDYRQFLDAYVLQPAASDKLKDLSFLVGETASSLKIDKGYNGVLNLAVKMGKTYGLHTLANILQGGRTEWPIRAELYLRPVESGALSNVLTPETSDFANTWILVHIFEDICQV